MATAESGNVEKIISIKFDSKQAVSGIASLNSQIEQNTKDLKDMANAGEKGTKAYAQLEQETKALKTQKNDLSRMVQSEIREQNTLNGSMKQMEAELRRLKLEYKNLSEAERESGQRGIELRNQINRTTTELKKAEYGIQEYYRNVGNYQNAILNALGINGRFGQSIMGLTNMQGGFSGAMASMGSSVKAFGASLMALMTNPVFLAIAGIAGVGMAFKWFYDYNEGLAEASRLTEQFTGLQGEQMQGFRDKVMATADVMGKDFKETLQAADTVMANFHVDGEQAMDAINKGFAAGADVNGDFLNKVKQFAPTFHDAGISAEQMVAIISQTKSGIFTDQGLEAIKQGSTRIREMSAATKQSLQSIGIDVTAMQAKLRDGTMTTFDALQQVSAQLKTMPDDSQEVGNVMADVFGRQGKFASQEMIESLADMSTSLDDVAAQTGDYGELLLENIDTEEELNNVTAALFDMTDNGWESIKQQATIYAKKALVAVVKGLVDVANWFINLYNKSIIVRGAFHAIVGAFKAIWSGAKLAFNLIIDGFKNIGRAINAIVNMFSQAGNAISAFGQGVYDIFAGIANRSLEQIKRGWNTLKNGVKGAVKSTIDGFVKALSDGWSEMGNDVASYFGDLGDIAGEAFTGAVQGHMDNIKIPALAGGGSASTGGGGGGGGSSSSSSSSGGSGGSRKSGGGGSRKSGGGSRKSGGGSRKSGGGSSRRTGGSGKRQETDEEKAEKAYQKRIDDLIKKGADLEMKALEEQAKKVEEKAEELAKKQKEALVKLYGGEEYLQKRLDAAKTPEQQKRWKDALEAYRKMEKQINEQEQENLKAIKANREKEAKEREKQAADLAKRITQIWIEQEKEGSEARKMWELDLLQQEEDAELAALDEQMEAVKGKNQELYDKLFELYGATVVKYQKKREQVNKEYEQKQKEEQQKYITELQTFADTVAATTKEHEQANLDWRLMSLRLQMENELAMYEHNEDMKRAIQAKYWTLEQQARQEHVNAVTQIEQTKYDAIAGMIGGIGQILGEVGEDQKEFLALQKTLAMGEIMIAQAVAIANAVKKASAGSITVWDMIAQITTGITAVISSIAQAFKALDQAKFATGGYVRGAGTSTSDSIPVRVSNGESIMNAETTAMFGGLLSSLNQLGGGVPIQVQETAASVRGEDMLARAFARGVAMLPNPVVSVEDINRGQRQVEVMNERATL